MVSIQCYITSNTDLWFSHGNEKQFLKLNLKCLGFNCGSKGGAVVIVLPSHPPPPHHCELGSNLGPGITCGLSSLLVLVLAPRGFLWVL